MSEDNCRKAFKVWFAKTFPDPVPAYSVDEARVLKDNYFTVWQAAYNRPKAEVDDVQPAKLIDAYCICGKKMTISGNFDYTPCADVAGLVEKLKKCPRVYGLETEEAISIIKQHFGSKP